MAKKLVMVHLLACPDENKTLCGRSPETEKMDPETGYATMTFTDRDADANCAKCQARAKDGAPFYDEEEIELAAGDWIETGDGVVIPAGRWEASG